MLARADVLALAVQILMKAMMNCGCQHWPTDQDSSLPTHLETVTALIRSRDEEVEATKSRCKQRVEDARLAKKAQREEQSRAQIHAAEEAQARRAAEEAQRRKDAAEARQARETRWAREHQEAVKRKAEQLAKQEAAKKVKAPEATGSRAGKATPQASFEQMGRWMSSWVPDGMLQVPINFARQMSVWTSRKLQDASVPCHDAILKVPSPCT